VDIRAKNCCTLIYNELFTEKIKWRYGWCECFRFFVLLVRKNNLRTVLFSLSRAPMLFTGGFARLFSLIWTEQREKEKKRELQLFRCWRRMKISSLVHRLATDCTRLIRLSWSFLPNSDVLHKKCFWEQVIYVWFSPIVWYKWKDQGFFRRLDTVIAPIFSPAQLFFVCVLMFIYSSSGIIHTKGKEKASCYCVEHAKKRRKESS
jgi:hypothetical protein